MNAVGAMSGYGGGMSGPGGLMPAQMPEPASELRDAQAHLAQSLEQLSALLDRHEKTIGAFTSPRPAASSDGSLKGTPQSPTSPVVSHLREMRYRVDSIAGRLSNLTDAVVS